LHSFSKSDKSGSIRAKRSRSQSNLICSDLAKPICAARRQHSLFNSKRGRGPDENQMTTPTMIRKICVFFFKGLDRSRLTNLDRFRLSDLEKERSQCNCISCC